MKNKQRVVTFAIVLGAIITGTMLFHVSERVQSAEQNLARIEAAAAKEAENIRVLRAEWAYLNRPDRLEALAQKHLKMERPAIQQIMVDSGELPPQPVPVAVTLPVAAQISDRPVIETAPPPLPRLKPRHDTKSFQSLLRELQGEGGRE